MTLCDVCEAPIEELDDYAEFKYDEPGGDVARLKVHRSCVEPKQVFDRICRAV